MILHRIALSSTCLLALALSGCGFHPRAELAIPANLGPVRVVGSDPYSPLADSLTRALTRGGAQMATVAPTCKKPPPLPVNTTGVSTQTTVSTTSTDANANPECSGATIADVATVTIASESWQQGPLSVDAFSQVREYLITYTVKFSFTAANHADIVPLQDVKVQKDFTYDTSHALGSSEEQETIRDEMQREMAASIIRSIGIALRNKH